MLDLVRWVCWWRRILALAVVNRRLFRLVLEYCLLRW